MAPPSFSFSRAPLVDDLHDAQMRLRVAERAVRALGKNTSPTPEEIVHACVSAARLTEYDLERLGRAFNIEGNAMRVVARSLIESGKLRMDSNGKISSL